MKVPDEGPRSEGAHAMTATERQAGRQPADRALGDQVPNHDNEIVEALMGRWYGLLTATAIEELADWVAARVAAAKAEAWDEGHTAGWDDHWRSVNPLTSRRDRPHDNPYIARSRTERQVEGQLADQTSSDELVQATTQKVQA